VRGGILSFSYGRQEESGRGLTDFSTVYQTIPGAFDECE
jgi:hypothetical protein